MHKRQLIPIVIIGLLLFIMWSTQSQTDAGHMTGWPFSDLGPAILQDSYLGRAPALESPFGMIGDIPGGYSLYTGSPVQAGSQDSLDEWIGSPGPWIMSNPSPKLEFLVIAAAFALVPLCLLAIIGRKSYGSTKTQ
ncbi:MAG: hypothetical protein ACTSPR_03010 [Candidatus Thorarchaeota archaeon]